MSDLKSRDGGPRHCAIAAEATQRLNEGRVKGKAVKARLVTN